MPLDLNDPSTWIYNQLTCGPPGQTFQVPYWVLADLDSYHEEFVDNANLTRVLIAVPWSKRHQFRLYALGFAEYIDSIHPYFRRYAPLPNPYQANQFLVSLKKFKIHAGAAGPGGSKGSPLWHLPDQEVPNGWWRFPEQSDALPPRVIYDAVFTCPPYDVVDQTTFENGGSPFKETIRYVVRDKEVRFRERKVPSFGFETDDAAATPIPEVGFIPFTDTEFTLTWCKVPAGRVPWGAIDNRALKVNNAPFDYPADKFGVRQVGGTYGRYKTGDVLFVGLGGRIKPYRDPHGQWLCDLPYVFRYQYADGAGDGMQKIPRNDGTWVRVRMRGSGAANGGAWAGNTAYIVGDRRTNGGNVYEVITAGTSAATGGPTGTGANITDGGVHWKFVGPTNAKFLYTYADFEALFQPEPN